MSFPGGSFYDVRPVWLVLLMPLMGGLRVSRGAFTAAGGSVSPTLREDFSHAGYTSTAAFLLDPRGIYSVPEDNTPSQIVLDTTEPNAYSSVNKSMRFDFPTGGRCADYTIGRNIQFAATTTECWGSLIVKFQASPRFSSYYPTCGSNPSPDFKLLFIRATPTSRGEITVLGYATEDGCAAGFPNNETGLGWAMSPATLCNGQDHEFRWHIKAGLSGTALMRVMVDGVSKGTLTGSTPSGTTFYGLAVSRNLNSQPNQAQSCWIKRIDHYTAGNDPVWGI